MNCIVYSFKKRESAMFLVLRSSEGKLNSNSAVAAVVSKTRLILFLQLAWKTFRNMAMYRGDQKFPGCAAIGIHKIVAWELLTTHVHLARMLIQGVHRA